MSDKKHKYMIEITMSGNSGETGEPIQEHVFRNRYTTKAAQVVDQFALRRIISDAVDAYMAQQASSAGVEVVSQRRSG